MEKNNHQASQAPGAEEAIKEAITPTLVKEYLKKDLSVAIACLNAVLSDPDLMDAMAQFMAGRWLNHHQSKPRE